MIQNQSIVGVLAVGSSENSCTASAVLLLVQGHSADLRHCDVVGRDSCYIIYMSNAEREVLCCGGH